MPGNLIRNILLAACLISSTLAWSQKKLAIDSMQLKGVEEVLGDDYGNVYLYQKKDFSLIKLDSSGTQLAKVMLPFPYKIQSVVNPLNIVMFSENAQEIKFLDQNLNDIQKINLGNTFGFVKCIYAEDLQFAWLIDDSNKTLVQYNFRSNTIINSFPFNIDLQGLRDFLVYNNRVYILQDSSFRVYSTQSKLLFSGDFPQARKLARRNEDILIFGAEAVSQLDGTALSEIFRNPDAKIVDKNSQGFLALIRDKLYLYKK